MRNAVWCLLLVLGVATASAQSITTGAVQGRVTDKDTGLALPGVTVTIGSQVTNTDENGNYKITELIPGTYEVVFEFDTTRAVRRGIVVSANGVTSLFHPLKIGEAVFIDGSPPPINIVSQAKETRIGRKAIESLPTGPTFEATLRNVAGTQNDGVGIAVSGSSALENRYLVDGIDITGLTYGDVGTSLLNDFIHEVQVVSGGYNAEYGRSTGGVVNIVTRSGTDEFRGSVFGVVTPGFLTAKRDAAPSNASSIDVTGDNAYNGHFGFELGGPIIKKRAWFYIGMAPQLARTNYTRVTKSQTDCRVRMDNGELSTCSPANADTDPDVDPKTGFYITDEIDREVRSATAKSAQVITKINVAATPDDQLQLSLIAVPNKSESPALFGLPATGTRTWGLTTDTAARWTSKLNKGATEIEALGAWHRSTANSGSIDPAYDDVPLQQLYSVDLVKMAALGGESAATAAGCQDFPGNPNDKYPLITNCPNNFNAYAVGGPGPLARDLEERRAGRFGLLHRIKAAGTHELKGGLDFEDNRKTKARLYSGGALIQNLGNSIQVNRYAELARPGENDPKFDRMCTISNDSSTGASMGGELVPCRYLGGLDDPSTRVEGHSVNWGAYLQDSWHPLQNLTFNAGMRYEEQRLYYAERLRGTPNPLTGEPLGDTAMKLRGNWSPRLGAIWDPSGEAKSKIYGAWGRYYEGIPMDINDRSFGGEVTLQQTYSPASCGPIDPKLGQVDGATCLGKTPESETMIGANGTLIAPGIKAQYMDEALLGGEIALPSNVVLGAVLQYRRLGRVIEDVSTDNAQTYLIANPGEWSREEEAKLVHQIATTTDKLLKGRLEEQLRMFQGVRIFDKPRRDYAAIELTVSRKFISGLYLSGSYTYSRAVGNYPGLVSYDNGQIDPNISSQYDLIELLANRAGKLPQDRPHYIKLDAYRDFDLGNESVLTVGGRVRALSGIPQNALGAHYLYGADESFLLPRGQIGRTEFEHGIDLHLGYKRKLTQGSTAELYVDVFNLYDRQGTFRVDETYAPQYSVSVAGAGGIEQNVNPISGGTYEDLLWAKTIDRNGVESSTPIGRNPNFGHTTARYAPASAQVGFRVTF